MIELKRDFGIPEEIKKDLEKSASSYLTPKQVSCFMEGARDMYKIMKQLNPEHMKHTDEVKGLIEALKRCLVCKMPDEAMNFEEYLNWNLTEHKFIAKQALKPFEKEAE